MTGSRTWQSEDTIRRAIKNALKYCGFEPSDAILVHGGAIGADTMAANIATELGMQTEVHYPNWEIHNEDCLDEPFKSICHKGLPRCKRAGHRRNKLMLSLGADVLLAFIRDNSNGATGTLRNAPADMKAFVYRESTTSEDSAL